MPFMKFNCNFNIPGLVEVCKVPMHLVEVSKMLNEKSHKMC